MVKYLVGILCSSNVPLLKESFMTVVNQQNFDDYEIVIIVNTLNEKFYQDIMKEFDNHKYDKLRRIIRTESNGYPGKGHNSVLKTFYKDYRYENLIMLDGDDFFYPNALERINDIQYSEKSDIIALYANSKIKNDISSINQIVKDDYTTNFNVNINYNVHEQPGVKHICDDFNKLLLTPNRLLCTNRKFLYKYIELYDERMYTFDDFMFTVLLYKERNNNEFNITHLSDPYIYLYNSINENSVSIKYTNEDGNDNEYDIVDNQNKLDLIKTHLDNKYDITEITIKPYHEIIHNSVNTEEIQFFYKNLLYNLYRIIPLTLPSHFTKICFIDYSDWDYNTINTRPLGGTESAFYNLSKVMSEKYSVYVFTKTNKAMKINNRLCYYPLDNCDKILQAMKPDIIIFQGIISIPKKYFTDINPNILLWNWIHHDITVSFLTNEVVNYPFDKYIFVSNWQKQRFIQKFGLEHQKCITMQNGISPLIDVKSLYNLKKERTLVYFSTPYRGLIIAYQLFLEIKRQIPDIKFKIFSCFSRDNPHNQDKSVFEEITDISKISNHPLDQYYKNLYKLLIEDKNVEFYGSVPQKVLFDHLKTAMILFYPNTYPETCCTSILEAMAHRCNIISSDLGAISETSNSFASLYNPCIDVLHDNYSTDDCLQNPIQMENIPSSYKRQFIDKTIDLVNNYYSDYNQNLLTNQQKYIANCTWEKRANIITKYIK